MLLLSHDYEGRYGQTDEVNDDNHHQHRLNSYGSNHNCPRKRLEDALDGGAEGVRTPDLLNAIQALYQLSYDPVQSVGNVRCRLSDCQNLIPTEHEVVGRLDLVGIGWTCLGLVGLLGSSILF